MKRVMIPVLAACLSTLAACGSSSSDTPPAYEGYAQPANTVAINFSVDDTVNMSYLADELQWKGAMLYDATTRTVTFPGNWDGPFAPLYDDGPWDVKNATTGAPGHEPKNSVAGDHKWGITVFASNATAATDVQYGLIDHKFGDGWVWQGTNGSISFAAGATTPIEATGMKFAAWGTTDLKLVLDTSALDTKGGTLTWDTSKIEVKGSGWAWNLVTMYDDGTHGDATAADGKYTFVASDWLGVGKTYYHTGLFKSGDIAQFVVVFNGVEYKVDTVPSFAGVTAQIKPAAGAWADIAITNQPAGDKNTLVTFP